MHNDDIKQYFFNPISKLGMAMNKFILKNYCKHLQLYKEHKI